MSKQRPRRTPKLFGGEDLEKYIEYKLCRDAGANLGIFPEGAKLKPGIRKRGDAKDNHKSLQRSELDSFILEEVHEKIFVETNVLRDSTKPLSDTNPYLKLPYYVNQCYPKIQLPHGEDGYAEDSLWSSLDPGMRSIPATVLNKY